MYKCFAIVKGCNLFISYGQLEELAKFKIYISTVDLSSFSCTIVFIL